MGGNFLIDTGASRSLISPESIGNFEFGQQITNEPYSISTAHGTSHHNQVAHIPLPPLFGTEPIVHKFLVFDFDSNYKGLIGNDLLRVLGARIDYNKKKLFTRTTAIPLLFDNIIIKRRLSQEAQLNNINTCRDDNELKNNLNRIRTNHLNSEEKREINKLCYQYRDIFYSEKMPLTFTHSVKHKLRLTDETPIFTKNYRKPPCEQVEIQKQVDDLVKKGIVRESMSPWSSPVHIVPKKADASGKVKWRLVIDYRKLNDRTIEDKFPIPNITDILDKLGRAQYFSTIDLASGYHQVEMDERDIEKTAFTTDRHYEFLRMPFGLKNAPSTFQRLMNNILRDLLYDTCIVYLDDILIYSVSLQDHIKKLKRVFDRLREHNFKVQLDKSEFLRKEVIYLGHTLTQEGLKPNEDKIKAIKKFPIPATQKEIKSFLGLVGYYRKFIPDFAKMTKPMTKCLKKNAKVTHTPEFIDSFNKSKDILCNAPVLQYPDFEKPFILTTDASDVSIGAVLSQGTVGTDRPIAYASRTLSQTEIKYSTIEKELLAIVWSTQSQVVRDDSNDIDVCDVDIRTLLDIPVTPSDTQSQRNENMDGITDNDDVITDDSNKIIPTCPDAIDKQLKQFHIRSSPGNEYRIEDHSKKNFVIKNKHKAQMENAQKLVSLKLSIDKEQTITKANKTSEIIPFKIGDKVYKQVAKTARSKKTEPRYLGPYTIIRIHPNNIYEIIGKHVNSKSIRVHCRLLRRPSVTIAESPSPASLRENIHLLENVIGIKAYSTLTSITFILEVPLISPASYDLLHLYSIPNNKNLTRIPKAPLLILGSKEYAYPHEPCQRLDDELSICNHLQLESIQNEDCIVQVIRHAATNNCRYAEVILPPVKIQQVHQNTWLVISRNPEILKVKCGNDEKYQRIQNTYLLTTTEACKLEINGQVLQTHHKTLNIKETIPLPRIHLPESNVTWKNVHLENINLDKLHAIATSISMQPEISNDYGIATKPSWTSIILIAILAAVAAYYARRKFGTIKCTRTKRNACNTPEDIELNAVPRTESTSLAQPLQLQAHTLAEHHRLREPTPTVRSPLGREELCRLSP
ncbi:hypothetical protein ABMA27_000562 [Loxostege sticticalis]|uniref:Reverse transcriptase domain-containing protein n=1 Tax=Loxostege sticticalis TaxID=481309 RepID=A0ABR3INV9_LOXSC